MKYKKLLATICTFGILSIIPAFAINETEAKLEYNKGIDCYKLGQYDKSVIHFRKAIELNPDLIDAYYNLGSILEYMKQDQDALVVFKQIVVRKPTDYESVYKAAELSKKLGYPEQAKKFLSIIPSGSYVNPKAQELAHSMQTDLQTIKHQNNQKEIQTQPQTNGVYENFASPTGITSDSMGNLYVASYSDNAIYKITPDGNKIIFLKDKRINGPIGVASDNWGNIYITNYNANNVLKIDTNGIITVLINNIAKPYGIYVSNGVLFVSSQGTNSIIRYKL